MGLSGPKKRVKISHDPNNTAWSRSTTNFGHKILTSQGWTPGQFLGAKDANHAEHYTAANASHVRVMLKEDNLGLGAKLGANRAETFGLSLFSGILGRLNGKSEEVLEKEQKAIRDVELAQYQGQRWGNINFISAGFLVGDKIEKDPDVAAKTAPAAVHVTPVVADSGTNTLKRKRGCILKEAGDTTDTVGASSIEEEVDADAAMKRRKAEKKARKDGSAVVSTVDEEKAAKAIRKAERRARKEERRKRKEERRAKKELKKKDKKPVVESQSDSADSEQSSATSASGTITPQIATTFIPRHAVRQRYIQQKRRAALDPQALKEIFMVKTTAA